MGGREGGGVREGGGTPAAAVIRPITMLVASSLGASNPIGPWRARRLVHPCPCMPVLGLQLHSLALPPQGCLPVCVCVLAHSCCEVASWRSMRNMNLSHCGLSTLPPAIGQLVTLRILRLSHNRLAALPPDLSKLLHLEVLAADHNQLATVPGAGRTDAGCGWQCVCAQRRRGRAQPDRASASLHNESINHGHHAAA